MSEKKEKTYYKLEVATNLVERLGLFAPLILEKIKREFSGGNGDRGNVLQILQLGLGAIVSGDEKTVRDLLGKIGKEIEGGDLRHPNSEG